MQKPFCAGLPITIIIIVKIIRAFIIIKLFIVGEKWTSLAESKDKPRKKNCIPREKLLYLKSRSTAYVLMDYFVNIFISPNNLTIWGKVSNLIAWKRFWPPPVKSHGCMWIIIMYVTRI